jgi:hypothetical protein
MKSLILFILLTYILSTKTTKWTAKELVQAFNNSPNKQMLDPDLYLQDKTLDEKTLVQKSINHSYRLILKDSLMN